MPGLFSPCNAVLLLFLLGVLFPVLNCGCDCQKHAQQPRPVQRTAASAPSPSIQAGATSAPVLEAEAEKEAEEPEEPTIIRAVGFVRGKGRTVLRNKYSGFVSKVNFYSHAKVKAGDVILEFDDLEWRTKVEAARNKITELEEQLKLKRLQCKLTQINPLPADFRNINWKVRQAHELMERLGKDVAAYEELQKHEVISDFTYREKLQAFEDAKSSYESKMRDRDIVKQGMADIYVQIANQEVASMETQLASRRRELALLEEDGKYYRIVAPYDGVTITNADTVHGYYTAGTSAAAVHRGDSKLVYAYFEEEDMPYIHEGQNARFRSNQYDSDKEGFAELKVKEVKSASRSTWGDGCYFLVKFQVMTEPVPLRLESSGVVEIELPTEKTVHPVVYSEKEEEQ
ncbi:MAG: hypothetical protein IJJ33_10525 [Victivallales bacterium]|nr:hypothetical protein [Victivallales bacterium]